jgi:hypothetical protein
MKKAFEFDTELETEKTHATSTNNPNGRPKLAVTKSKQIVCWVTEEEQSKIVDYAKKFGGVSSLIRSFMIKEGIL